jgi:ribosomal protein S18 acetylase RimI-like enzyme
LAGDIRWMLGPEPKNLSPTWTQEVLRLFLRENGEQYSQNSVSNLPIPKWGGNLLLLEGTDTTNPNCLKGLLWATPFMKDIVRIAAFSITSEHQGKGYGRAAWNSFVDSAIEAGFSKVQLEVKASNIRGQEFYRQRGLIVMNELQGYYTSGLGYMMRGDLNKY